MRRETPVFDIYLKELLKGEKKMMLAKAIFDQLTTLQKFKFLLQRINSKITKEQFVNNYQILVQPKKYMSLVRAASNEDGIIKLSDQKIAELEALPLSSLPGKFIPMSGAASRMFGFLKEFLKTGEMNPKVATFISGLDKTNLNGPKFAFLEPLETILKKNGFSLQSLIEEGQYKEVIRFVLEPKGLNYENLPKGLIYFHLNEKGRPVLALEEHMIEALRDTNGKLAISISPEHKKNFLAAIKEIKQLNPALKSVEVTISYQDPATDSIAIDPVTKKIILDANGRIAKFAAGHGSLITNYEDPRLTSNVDSLPTSKDAILARQKYYRLFAALTAQIKSRISKILNDVQKPGMTNETELLFAISALKKQGVQFCMNYEEFLVVNLNKKIEILKQALDRPLAVIGVVVNQGEPGGGPFVIEYNGYQKLSIVEKDEIAPDQMHLMQNGKYFNPVYLMVDPLKANGEKYDLVNFSNVDRYFLVEKPYQGKKVLRMEHPGLWNGRMDGFTTLFVEIPIETFAPVKEVNDLLRPEHQFNPDAVIKSQPKELSQAIFDDLKGSGKIVEDKGSKGDANN